LPGLYHFDVNPNAAVITGLLEKYPLITHFPTAVRFLRLGAA